MKYTFEAYMNRFEAMTDEIQEVQGELLLTAALNGKAMIKKRVIETGINHEGQRFASPNNPSGYSKKPMLTNGSGFFVKSGNEQKAGSKEKRKELKWVTIKKGNRTIRLYELEGGYEEFRKLQGRQVNHVDFSMTGRMWANVDIRSKSYSLVVLGPLADENRKKMEGQVARFGTILALSDNELANIQSDMENSIQTIVNTHLK